MKIIIINLVNHNIINYIMILINYKSIKEVFTLQFLIFP
jgi:hypothetical protein